ncbi:hypothetical protein [Nostoc sp.]|uniref:hypothetical protein n=1 Tax=Nostoc sp. TaxID=1180 RepID=UPI002FF730F2
MNKNRIKAKAADDKNLQTPVGEELSDYKSQAVCGGNCKQKPKKKPLRLTLLASHDPNYHNPNSEYYGSGAAQLELGRALPVIHL